MGVNFEDEPIDGPRLAHVMWAQDKTGNRQSGKSYYNALAAIALAIIYERDTPLDVPDTPDKVSSKDRMRVARGQAERILGKFQLGRTVRILERVKTENRSLGCEHSLIVRVEPYEVRMLEPRDSLAFMALQIELRKYYQLYGQPEFAKTNGELQMSLLLMHDLC